MNPITATQSPQGGVAQSAGTLPERHAVQPAQAVETVRAAAPVTEAQSSKHNAEQRSAPAREVVQQAAKQIESFVKDTGRALNFAVDESTGYSVVKVTDPSTNEVIRQIPGDEVLKIARTLDYLQNVLVSQKA